MPETVTPLISPENVPSSANVYVHFKVSGSTPFAVAYSSIETAVPSVPSSAVTVQVPTTLADESPSFESEALSSALFALSSAVCDAELSFLLDESPSLPQPTRPTVPVSFHS